jgi:hypothetical protein
MNEMAKGRSVIVIEILGETILQSELDNLAENWTHFGMPRGKYTLHPKEVEQLTNDIRKLVAAYNKVSQ